jgi:tetraprenyl-beta-curcumene synthase
MSCNNFHSVGRMLFYAYPVIKKELKYWEKRANACPDQTLKQMAISSLKLKRFHCLGGSFYSLPVPGAYRIQIIKAIIALQTISDYLDNLCDRAGVCDVEGFSRLHHAFTGALNPEADAIDNYYLFYPYCRDGGYLNSLVQVCREAVLTLPHYHLVQESVLELAGLYCRLQVNKHISWDMREKSLVDWLVPLLAKNSGIFWWELAAATGSTLGIFALLALASGPEPNPEVIEKVYSAYFPWIGGLHILLDYFIDQAEDRIGGDLNFAFYYHNLPQAQQRLEFFLKQSLKRAGELPQPHFHKLIVNGLLAMYLSDPKIGAQNFQSVVAHLFEQSGPDARGLYCLCLLFRRFGMI